MKIFVCALLCSAWLCLALPLRAQTSEAEETEQERIARTLTESPSAGVDPEEEATEAASETPSEGGAETPDTGANESVEEVTETVTEVSETIESDGETTVTAETTEATEEVVVPTPTADEQAAIEALTEPAEGELGPDVMEDLIGDELLPEGIVTEDDLPDPSSLLPAEDYYFEEAPPAPVVQENKFEQERQLRVRYQEVKQTALKDQAIRDMKRQAETARTDEAKRQALREYYRMLFSKMKSIDAELAEKCDVMERAYLARLAQTRVEPTIPLNPPPTPEPLVP